jgi:hypothetical protein
MLRGSMGQGKHRRGSQSGLRQYRQWEGRQYAWPISESIFLEIDLPAVVLTYLMSGHGWTVTISPCLTRRLCLTTRFIRALPSSNSSSARTMRTVSLRFLPFTSTVSPRNSCRVSMVLLESAITELSSLTASVTLLPPCQCTILETRDLGNPYINELGFFFFFRMAVAVSSA